MGDLRFERSYRRVKQAADRAATIRSLSDEDIIGALAFAREEVDPYLANVLASEALNRLHRASSIVLTATEGLLSQSVDGLLTYMNPAAEKLLGWTFDELRGKPVHDIVHGRRPDGTSYPTEECPIHLVAASGLPLRRHQTHLWRKDGMLFPAQQDAAAIIRDGEIEGVVIALRDIRGELVAQESQRASEAKFRSLFEEAPTMYMIVAGDGRVLSTNRFGEEYLGYGRKELHGRLVWDLFHPNDRDRVRAEHFGLFAEPPPPGRPREFEARKVCKDGTVLHVREFAVPTRDERGETVALQSCHDISHAKMAEARERAILESITDAFFTEDKELARETLRRALSGEQPPRVDLRVRSADGSYLALDVLATPRMENGRVTGVFGIGRDVSARREDEIRLRVRAEERTAELREVLQDLETFTNSVSHDLRAPLRGVAALLDDVMLDHGHTLTPEVRDLVERAQREDRRATRLVHDILAFSRGGRDPIRREPVDLSEAARAAGEEVVASHPEWRTRLVVQEGLRTEADPKLMRILLHNLVDNAAKYASVSKEPTIEVGSELRDGRLWFYVRDNGVGFPPGETSRLFRPFSRLSSAAGFEGTGLGLPTAKRIVERHGGEIMAEGRPREGATFRFTLSQKGAAGDAHGKTAQERLLDG